MEDFVGHVSALFKWGYSPIGRHFKYTMMKGSSWIVSLLAKEMMRGSDFMIGFLGGGGFSFRILNILRGTLF